MLIAIFALLLVSVVAIALIVSSGTETTLARNYRTSTSAYYAGLAGLEEGRGRLSWRNPDSIYKAAPGFMQLPGPGVPPLNSSQVLYILNPAGGETVAPWDLSNPSTYPDSEYFQEYGIVPTQSSIPSMSNNGGIPSPLYKWVRVTPATAASLGVDLFNSGPPYSNSAVFYDPIHSDNGGFRPSLVATQSDQTTRQAIEITALAVLPNNTQKMVQYVVAPMGLFFHSALEMPGVVGTFKGPQSQNFQVSGIDGSDGSGPPAVLPGCIAGDPSMAGVGVTDAAGLTPNYSTVVNGIPPGPPPPATSYASNYTGALVPSNPPTPPAPPSVQENVYVDAALASPSALSGTIQRIVQSADVVLTPTGSGGLPGTATDASLPTQMSQNNPMIVVVNGNLKLSGTVNGYGLLVVTGDYTTTAGANVIWKGLVMVVGTGNVSLSGSNSYIGNFFVAQIEQPFGNPLTSFGTVTFDASNATSGAAGQGIYHNSCWIRAALLPSNYKILSFREIPYP